jgi:alpha-D-ribose 1-methylphosphonate 5-phosphate C-P lyase
MVDNTEKQHYNFAFLDEGAKREIRRAIVKAVAIPGYQVPFASRELPIGRGWGTGGLQITLALIGKSDCLKVIDQGSDDSVNAVSIRKLVTATTGVATTTDTETATIIQSRHRIPEERVRNGQIMVLQVPNPEPLRSVSPRETVSRNLHAEAEYSGIWLRLYEAILKYGWTVSGADHPVTVAERYVMNPSPIPRFDNPKLHQADCLHLFGAGREKKIYAVPPYTEVVSLAFEDHPFEVEEVSGRACKYCGATGVYFDEIIDNESHEHYFQCSDSGFCAKRRGRKGGERGE